MSRGGGERNKNTKLMTVLSSLRVYAQCYHLRNNNNIVLAQNYTLTLLMAGGVVRYYMAVALKVGLQRQRQRGVRIVPPPTDSSSLQSARH